MADQPLSDREQETLRGLAEGASQEDLARAMFCAVSTVKGYIRQVYDKLHARNAAHAVHIAHQRGLLGPSTSASTAVHEEGLRG
jgi:LuxR family transcriptional regulator, maltose regulon positive regulatory protein